MPPSASGSWTRIGASLLLIATALTGAFVTAAPAQAVPIINCSTLVGSISTDDSFNAAVAQVNNGYCNVLDISSGFDFDVPPTAINSVVGNYLSITGPANPADDSTLDGRSGPGMRIIQMTGALQLDVERLTFTGFNSTSPAYGQGESALQAEASGVLTANFQNVSFTSNVGQKSGGLHLQSNTSAAVTMTGRIHFADDSTSYPPLLAGGALTVASNGATSLTLGSVGGDDTITFSDNQRVSGSGGAIVVSGPPSSTTITVNGASFTNNSATATGGAIYSSGNAILNGATVTGNTAFGNEGGALHAEQLVTITGGTFHGNQVTGTNGAGGAVSAGGDVTTNQITNATFTNNSARGHGGAVRTLGLLAVTGSTFSDDSAGASGGAIAADDTVSVTSTLFHDDTAAGSGGAIISIYASVLSQQSTYSGGTSGDNGGAISAGLGRMTSTQDTFIGNRANRYDGGAIAAVQVTTTGSTFTNNRAGRNGGAVGATSVDDSGSIYAGNSAVDRGGAVDVSSAATFMNSTFEDDSATQGGAIYSFGPLTLTNSLFEDDTAATLGGAVVAYDTLSVNSSTFRRNVALETGGAIFVDDTTTVVNSLFQSNEARGPSFGSNGAGGAIFSSGFTTITGSTFATNRSEQEGGALSVSEPLVLTDDTFTSNVSVNRTGGAVDVAAPGTITVTSSTFTSNAGGADGGAIRIDGPATVTSSTFSANRTTTGSKNGGAISAFGSVSVTSSNFTSNTSTQWGGAIDTQGSATVADSTFAANTTSSSGGALYIDDTGTITSSTFTDDTSAQLGGAITVGDLVMQTSSFVGNRSGLNGGAIFVRRTANVSNSTFVANYGGYGGAISFAGSSALSRIAFSTLLDNTTAIGATSQGTAINAPGTTPIALTGSVLAGVAPLCFDDTTGPTELNLTSTSSYSFATDTSCSGNAARSASTSINTLYTTDDSLGLTATITTDDTPGMQVVIPDDTSVVNSYVPLSVLPSVTNDQIGGYRNSLNSLTSAGAVQVRPISVSSPANASVTAGSNATFSVTGYPGIGPTITYQWQSSTNGSTWSNVSGAQTATLTLPSVTQSQSGLQVRVLVADAYGNDDTSTTATLTVTTPTPGPAPTPTPTPTPAPSPSPEPIPSPIPPGGSLLQVDGRTVPVDVQPRPGNAGLRVQGEGWDMTLDGLNRDGQPLGVNPQGALVTDIGSGVRMGGSGFQPGSQIGFFLDPPVVPSTSTAYRANVATTDLGDITINADGRYSATIEMPDDIAPGPHVLQAVGVGTSGERRVLSLGIVVDAWIDLKRGKRTPAGRFDLVRATGTTGGLPAGAVLTPWVRSPGQGAFRRGSGSITVRADGSFQWTRKVQKSKGLAAYVSYKGNDSNKVYWARLK